MKRRVALTGIGLLTPLAAGVQENWDALMAGRSGIGPTTHFDVSDYSVKFGGEVKDFDPTAFMGRKAARRFDRFIQFAMAAAKMALEDCGLTVSKEEAQNRFGVIIGSGIGGLPMIERECRTIRDKGPSRVSPFFIPGVIINMASGMVAIEYGLRGPNTAVCTACSTGSHAIGEAFRLIESGEADAMVAGGTEAVITPLAVAGFTSMKALSTRNDEPEKASRPFDRGRDGFVMSEGAGVVILEAWEAAKKRGARIYSEIVGYGMSGDAFHITAPPQDGHGAIQAMEAALKCASLNPSDIDYINAHGTSTPVGDIVETQAIKKLFGSHAQKLAISSTKSMTGHLLGAAGGAETAFCALALYHGALPPTINLDDPDEACDLDYVPHTARETNLRTALNNSFGFGGTNACLILKKPD